jgi:DNA-binding IclR family transcriptional regulator
MSVPGLERGIAILRLFGRDRTCLAAPQIADELAIPRSTAHRLLASLVGLDLLRRTDDGRFTLASGVLTLGHACLASLDIVELSDGILAGLRDEIGWSTHLAIRRERSVVYLLRHASRAAVTTNIVVGTIFPAHATLMGRVLLSGLPPAQLHALYGGVPLAAERAETPISLTQLEELVAADRARGYAACHGFYEPGVSAVAAPVRDGSNEIVAAINATTTAGTGGSSDLCRIAGAVLRAADAISASLGAAAGPASSARTTASLEETSWV